ncbi:MAG: hypothetical protein WAU05_14250 [Nitrospira sp.]
MLGSTLPRRKKDGATTTPGGLERLDRLVEKNRERLDAVCKARGVDFGRMTEEERERFVDHILGA